VTINDAASAIAHRAGTPGWHESHPQLARRTTLPIAEVDDRSTGSQVRIGVRLRPGADPAQVRDQIAGIYGISIEEDWAFPAPLASVMRAWVDRYRGEDIGASLDRLEDAIRRDRRRELRNR
jgi:hypothetical protein